MVCAGLDEVKRLLPIAIAFWAAAAAAGQDPPRRGPHPAVVRLIVPGHGSTSFGSGALIAVNENHGLVVTNWHVVREGAGQIEVVFPDGFRSAAKLIGTDRDWDLAALVIWRPPAEPIRLATEAPRPGEPLTIVGYGRGRYREATGRCVQYVSPGGNMPFEMVELSTPAREGDSGGPILNHRGELAGVLFGAARGRTTGSYCGRVRWFLRAVAGDFGRRQPNETMIAGRRQPNETMIAGREQPDETMIAGRRQPAARTQVSSPQLDACPTAAIPARPPQTAASASSGAVPDQASTGWAGAAEQPDVTPAEMRKTPKPLGWRDVVGWTLGQQIKSLLALIGMFAVIFHGLRLLGSA